MVTAKRTNEHIWLMSLNHDGYDAGWDRGLLQHVGGVLPGWVILALRPSFTLSAPRRWWPAGVACWRYGYAAGQFHRKCSLKAYNNERIFRLR